MALYTGNNKVCITKQNRVPVTGIEREVSSQGVIQLPTHNFSFTLPSNATNLDSYALAYAFYNPDSYEPSYITSADFSSLKHIDGDHALDSSFYACANLTSVDFSSLETIDGQYALYRAFYYCTSLTSVSFSSLVSITGNKALSDAFVHAENLETASFPNLTTIGSNVTTSNCAQFAEAFQIGGWDSTFTSLSFPELTTIYCTGTAGTSNGTFYSLGSSIKKIYFPKLTTITYGTGASSTYQGAYKNIFYGTSLTEIHFGAANQAAIEANPGYSTLWGRGAGNATVYFDL